MLDEDFTSGKSLADAERAKFLNEIEMLKSENARLKQNLNLMSDIYEGYIKKIK